MTSRIEQLAEGVTLIAPAKQNRSSEELEMRALVVSKLRARWPDARIVHELPLRYSSNRIDLAAVCPTEIISVEIKSSLDVADRLEAQLRAFLPISSRVIVALAPKWNEKLPEREVARKIGGRNVTSYLSQFTEAQEVIHRVGGCLDVWTVNADTGSIDVTRESYRTQRPWAFQLLDMLHVTELVHIAGKHRCWSGKRPVHLDLVNACNDLMSAREVTAAVCAALRARVAFARESDAPIKQPDMFIERPKPPKQEVLL